MPEVWFTLRWPDESEERCYSPSTAINDYLQAGQTYPLLEFQKRAQKGLLSASNRVQQIYGSPCSRALDQLTQIETKIKNYDQHHDPQITCIDMST